MQTLSSSLDEIHESIWRLIMTGCEDASSDAHWPMLATTDAVNDPTNAIPNVRTMVLRAASRSEAWLQCHTEYSSAKITELKVQSIAMLAFYDRSSRIQIRIKAEVSIHNQDEKAVNQWRILSLRQRQDYISEDSFTLLQLSIQTIDWLRLSGPQHQRAQFDYRQTPTAARHLKL